MFLMMAEVLQFCAVASALPESAPDRPVWKLLCQHQSHVEWTGCVLHDMIQPSFSFLVGVALVFSIASRRARGQSMGWLTAHTRLAVGGAGLPWRLSPLDGAEADQLHV